MAVIATVIVWAAVALSAAPTVAAASASVACTAASTESSNVFATTDVVAAGASLPRRVYELSTLAYSVSTGAGDVSYESTGSGTGKSRLLSNVVDWAGTDSLFDASAYTSAPDLQMLPALAVAVAPVFNVDGVPSSSVIVLSDDLLARVFLGTVWRWNDDEIVALNPSLALPNATIQVIVRQDKSGSTSIFTEALALFNSNFSSTIGAGSLPVWNYAGRPVAAGSHPGTSGVAGALLSTRNSITYLSSDTAKELSLGLIGLAKAGGGYILPDRDGIQTAQLLRGDAFSADFTVSLVSQGDPSAYPIASYTYIAVRKDTDRGSCLARAATVEFLVWFYTSDIVSNIIHDAGFAPLLDATAQQVLAILTRDMTCNATAVVPTLAASTLRGRGSDAATTLVALIDSIWAVAQQPQVTIAFEPNTTLADDTVFALALTGVAGVGVVTPAEWITLPLAALTAFVAVNLPGVGSGDLVLDVATLASILDGTITHFDDAAVAALNPSLTLPHTAVQWVSAPGSDCASIIAAALSSQSATLAAAVGSGAWPAATLGAAFVDAEVVARVAFVGGQTTGALWCTTAEPSIGAAVTVTGVAPLAASTACDGGAAAAAAAGAVFFSACAALHLQQRFTGTFDCQVGQHAVDFAAWVFSDGLPTLEATDFAPVSAALLSASVAALDTVTCDSVSIRSPPQPCTAADVVLIPGECGFDALQEVVFAIDPASDCLADAPTAISLPSPTREPCDHVPFVSVYGIIVYVVVVAVGVVMLLVGRWVARHKLHPVIKYSQPLFCYMYLFGGWTLATSMIAFLGPNNDVTCRVRIVAFNTAFSLMFIPLHLKTYRVYRIFDNPQLKRVVIKQRHLLMRVAILLAVELAFSAVWLTVSGMVASSNESLLVGYPPLRHSVCQSSDSEFPTIMFGWKAVQLATGLFFALKTWHIPSLFSEARPFAAAIGNIAFVGSIASGLTLLLPLSASSRVLMQVFATCYGVLTSELAVFVPKRMKMVKGQGGGASKSVRNPLTSSTGSYRMQRSAGRSTGRSTATSSSIAMTDTRGQRASTLGGPRKAKAPSAAPVTGSAPARRPQRRPAQAGSSDQARPTLVSATTSAPARTPPSEHQRLTATTAAAGSV